MTDESEKEILKELREIRQEMTRTSCAVEGIQGDTVRYQDWLQSHELELGGSGDIKGIRTRMVELETAQRSQVWYWRAAVTAFFGSMLGWIVHFFGGDK